MTAQLPLNEADPGVDVVSAEDRLLEEPHRLLRNLDSDAFRIRGRFVDLDKQPVVALRIARIGVERKYDWLRLLVDHPVDHAALGIGVGPERMKQSIAENHAFRIVERDVGPLVLDHVEIADRCEVGVAGGNDNGVRGQSLQHRLRVARAPIVAREEIDSRADHEDHRHEDPASGELVRWPQRVTLYRPGKAERHPERADRIGRQRIDVKHVRPKRVVVEAEKQ